MYQIYTKTEEMGKWSEIEIESINQIKAPVAQWIEHLPSKQLTRFFGPKRMIVNNLLGKLSPSSNGLVTQLVVTTQRMLS